MKVGYVPYSADLSHPGDRRRLGFWAHKTHNRLEINEPLNSDVLVLSNAANFNYWIKRAKQPVILDLVDAYFGETPNILEDFGRNVIRSVSGSSSFKWYRYSKHISYAIKCAKYVVVASEEQAKFIDKLGGKPFVIRDSHQELESEHVNSELKSDNQIRILWEGFGYTFKHFKVLSNSLDNALEENDWFLDIVSTAKFPRWGGKFGEINLQEEVKKLFPISFKRIEIIPWTIQNLKNCASKSDLAIIPIDLTDSFAKLKSENKLLSMWSLELSTFVSATPSYRRVLEKADLEHFIVEGDWSLAIKNYLISNTHKMRDKQKIKNYLYRYHTNEIIVANWNKVLNSTFVD